MCARECDVHHAVRIQLLEDDSTCVAHEEDETSHLDAACRRARAPANHHEEEQDHLGEGWPRLKVRRHKSRRRQRGHLKYCNACRHAAVHPHRKDEVERDEEHRREYDAEIGAKLRIAQNDRRSLDIGTVVE